MRTVHCFTIFFIFETDGTEDYGPTNKKHPQKSVQSSEHTQESNIEDEPILCQWCGVSLTKADISKKQCYFCNKPLEDLQSQNLSFRCEKCNNSFGFLKNLEAHMKTHSFQCDKCCITFEKADDLNIHLKYHTDVNCFVCGICKDTFSCISVDHKENKF